MNQEVKACLSDLFCVPNGEIAWNKLWSASFAIKNPILIILIHDYYFYKIRYSVLIASTRLVKVTPEFDILV